MLIGQKYVETTKKFAFTERIFFGIKKKDDDILRLLFFVIIIKKILNITLMFLIVNEISNLNIIKPFFVLGKRNYACFV